MRFFRAAYKLLANDATTADAGAATSAATAGAGTSVSSSASLATTAASSVLDHYEDPASAAIAARHPDEIYIGGPERPISDDPRLWVKAYYLRQHAGPFIPLAEEAKGELSAEQKEFNRLVVEEKPIAEKEAAVLSFLTEHPDFNTRYLNKDGYTPLFLARKYKLTRVIRHFSPDFKTEEIFRSRELRLQLLEGIIKRDDIRAFVAFIKHWKLGVLDFHSSFGEKLAGDADLELGLALLPFMAKLNRRAMIERALSEDPTVVNERISDRATGRGYPSALIEATRAGHKDLVEFLLERGADRDFTTHKGETALSVAEALGHEAIATLLRPPPAAIGFSA